MNPHRHHPGTCHRCKRPGLVRVVIRDQRRVRLCVTCRHTP